MCDLLCVSTPLTDPLPRLKFRPSSGLNNDRRRASWAAVLGQGATNRNLFTHHLILVKLYPAKPLSKLTFPSKVDKAPAVAITPHIGTDPKSILEPNFDVPSIVGGRLKPYRRFDSALMFKVYLALLFPIVGGSNNLDLQQHGNHCITGTVLPRLLICAQR